MLRSEDVRHGRRDFKARFLALVSHFLLEIAEKMAKVNVEKGAVTLDHDVIAMPISNSHDIRGHAISSQGAGELVLSHAVSLLHLLLLKGGIAAERRLKGSLMYGLGMPLSSQIHIRQGNSLHFRSTLVHGSALVLKKYGSHCLCLGAVGIVVRHTIARIHASDPIARIATTPN